MRIVAALGGKALREPGDSSDPALRQHEVDRAVEALAPLVRAHDLIVTHGNGSHVGPWLVDRAAGATPHLPYPLDALEAQTQGMIGYWLAQALHAADPSRDFAALVSQTVVRVDDPAFSNPSTFVGQVYSKEQADRLARERSWVMGFDGSGWRRVVASPMPHELVESSVIKSLVDRGTCVICCGGGGVPVVRGDDGRLRGIEAVVEKDHTAALLAELVGAQDLLLLTDVPAVEIGFATASARPIRHASVAELRAITFPGGSMGPKVEAACDFTEVTGNRSAIGRLEDAAALVAGSAGTIIERNEVS